MSSTDRTMTSSDPMDRTMNDPGGIDHFVRGVAATAITTTIIEG